jgi:trehalose/maltose transport system permease protein
MNEDRVRTVLIACGGALLVLFALAPFVWMVWVSLVSRPDFLSTGSAEYTLSNYADVLGSPSLHFMSYFANSLIVSAVTAVVVTVLTCFAGYAVSRLRFPGRIAVPLFVLAMSMFPQISIVGFLFRTFSSLGWLNTHAALVLPYTALTVPLALWINMSYFAQIPVDLDKAALVDGAGRVRALIAIVLPLALPGIFSSFLLVFIQCFNEFLFAIMLTTDYHAQTLPVGIALFVGTHGEIPWGNLMAASVIGSVPLVGLTLLCQRYIIAGLTGGAVKG